MTSLATSQDLVAESVSVQSGMPDSLESVQANWNAVADPITLTTLTVLLLSWLLLFLIVTDSVEARDRRSRSPSCAGTARAAS